MYDGIYEAATRANCDACYRLSDFALANLEALLTQERAQVAPMSESREASNV